MIVNIQAAAQAHHHQVIHQCHLITVDHHQVHIIVMNHQIDF